MALRMTPEMFEEAIQRAEKMEKDIQEGKIPEWQRKVMQKTSPHLL